MTSETHNGGHQNSRNEFEGRHIRAKRTIHGTLVEVFGVGILLLGDSGAGKSNCALELIFRGHKLVADDSVEITVNEKALVGRAPKRIKGLMNIRGIGLINIISTLGQDTLSEHAELALGIELLKFPEADTTHDRIDVIESFNVLDINVPKLVLSVSDNRNAGALIEIAAKFFLLKRGASVKQTSALSRPFSAWNALNDYSKLRSRRSFAESAEKKS